MQIKARLGSGRLGFRRRDLADKPGFKQRLNRTVEGAGPEPGAAGGLVLDPAHDLIAVQVVIDE